MIIAADDHITEDQLSLMRLDVNEGADDPDRMGIFLSRFGWALRVECNSRAEMLKAAAEIRQLGYEVREYAK